MTIYDMLGQSGVIALLGMGVVFSFLVILVISITIVGKIISSLGLNKVVQPVASTEQKHVDTTAITAAISAAVNEYRKSNKS